MLLMILGLVIFLGLHSMQIVEPVRAGLTRVMGEIGYKVVYSIGSLVGLIAIAEGYKAWKYVDGSPILYNPPAFLAHISLLLMALAFIALPAAYLNGYIRKALKHPMLVAVKLWATAHLLANGDAASVLLFGAFLAWAVVDRISVKKRERAGLKAPVDFTPRVSADIAAAAIGLIVYALFVWKVHLWLIGVSPIAM
ncbi:NnrU family protein [Acuticoccus sp. MNP-M23]|uniref:NnrU family protein n=1 Tax=Acuticoccus sp. MNP-M23 TaxID=3072793 RepID=UPI0028155F86|nr:NnrU family protein [Acuticoccus sp. MNP-M23]WMS41258.1 NnrU family protein [Acuticoccus sp. MNP-M23]